MTWAEAKDLAAIVQSLAIAAATVIGGGWALFRFLSLQSIRKARLDLERAKRELSERGTLQVTLHAEPAAAELGRFINLRATLSNVGNRSEVIDWNKSSVSARLVEGVADGVVSFSKDVIRGQRPTHFVSSNVAPGESLRHSFLFPVPVPGLYYIVFEAHCSALESSLVEAEELKAGIKKTGGYTWSEDLFVNVPTSAA